MANRKKSAFTRITTLISGDLIDIVRTAAGYTDAGNIAIEKSDFDTYILALMASSSYTTLTIGTGVTSTVALGLVATYEGFTIEYIIGQSTARFSGNIELNYDAASAEAYPPNGGGDYSLVDTVNGLNIEQAIISGGYFTWKLTNNTGSSITIKYRVSESKPAI